MKELKETNLPGVYLFKLKMQEDNRGLFIKSFSQEFINSSKIDFEVKEAFFTTSNKNVIRGLHFQIDDYAQKKLVYCHFGSILDVVVDIRRNSPFYNEPFFYNLKGEEPYAILIEEGFAHGFLSLENNSIVQYFTNTPYSPEKDKGILWNSINFEWPVKYPIISKRDLEHPKIQDDYSYNY